MWNASVGRLELSGVMNSTAPVSSGDGVNSVAFAPTLFGQTFGKYVLGVAYYRMAGSRLTEVDVILNQTYVFDSYRGGLKFPIGGGFAIPDIQRVFLHELGHGIGLNHP